MGGEERVDIVFGGLVGEIADEDLVGILEFLLAGSAGGAEAFVVEFD